MNDIDAIFAKVAKENQKAEAKTKKPAPAAVLKEAAFLLRWSKGKPIVRHSADSTFWACGKYATQMTFKMAQALADGGHATLTGDPKKGGARLVMVKK